jgi:dienelactone hydrolase
VSAAASLSRQRVDHISVIWAQPERGTQGAPLALWLPGFGIDKVWVAAFLGELADAGFLAVCLDPWQHGERATESAEEIRRRVFGAYRRYKWPILGQMTLDARGVTDWAMQTLGAGPTVVAGGTSMGGDGAVTLAGIDHRVTSVAAIGASGDWTGPGMRGFEDPSTPLDQCNADAYGQWFYDHLDPLTHLDAYARGTWIAFECGGDDFHMPADGALRLRDALHAAHPSAGAGTRQGASRRWPP